jgi:hypothetical protein
MVNIVDVVNAINNLTKSIDSIGATLAVWLIVYILLKIFLGR